MRTRPPARPVTPMPQACASMCADDRDGHAVSLLRLRLAHLHPGGWVDAVVTGTGTDGAIDAVRWADGEPVRLWHHVHRPDLLAPGAPVAVHSRYGVLAIGDDRLNVARR